MLIIEEEKCSELNGSQITSSAGYELHSGYVLWSTVHFCQANVVEKNKQTKKKCTRPTDARSPKEFMAARTHCAATVTVFTPDSSVDQTKQRTEAVEAAEAPSTFCTCRLLHCLGPNPPKSSPKLSQSPHTHRCEQSVT